MASGGHAHTCTQKARINMCSNAAGTLIYRSLRQQTHSVTRCGHLLNEGYLSGIRRFGEKNAHSLLVCGCVLVEGGGEQEGSGITYHLGGISLTSYLFHKILRYEACSWASGIFQPRVPSVKHTASPSHSPCGLLNHPTYTYVYMYGAGSVCVYICDRFSRNAKMGTKEKKRTEVRERVNKQPHSCQLFLFFSETSVREETKEDVGRTRRRKINYGEDEGKMRKKEL